MRTFVLAFVATCVSASLLAQSPSPPPLPAAEADISISAQETRQTAEDFARMLEERFLFPDIAAKYAERLRRGAASGEYDDAGTRGALASLLTEQVQAVYPDAHLKMIAQSAAASSPLMKMMTPPPQQRAAGPASPGPGKPIEEARWLAPGVAYIRFTLFPFDPAVTAATAKFMADHADAKSMIFDLRTHRGGGMSQTAALLPYLFDKETVFLSQDTRAATGGGGEGMTPPHWIRLAASQKEGVRTEEIFVKPHPTERRLFDAKVFVLTSSYTVSAAEAFAFGFKATGRATLIGERTTGAGHFAPPGQRVNDKFAAFVPIGRAYDPRSGKGWEATGVLPDVEVPAEQALVEALIRSGLERSEAEKLSASVHPPGPMRRPRKA